jgi:hypothetical protein
VLTLCKLGLWEEISVSDWRKLSHGRNVCSDWLNLESFLFTAENSWTLLAREVRSQADVWFSSSLRGKHKNEENVAQRFCVWTSYKAPLVTCENLGKGGRGMEGGGTEVETVVKATMLAVELARWSPVMLLVNAKPATYTSTQTKSYNANK